MTEKGHLTFCQHCHMKCRISVTVADGRAVQVKNLMGVDCPKSGCSAELVNHPERIINPLKRTGDRGGGGWKPIRWDEALDIMASSFTRIRDRFGALANGVTLGCAHKEATYHATFLFSHVMGTPNVIDINRQCNIPELIGTMVTFGDGTFLAETGPDFINSRCILLWGANPAHTYPPIARDIRRACRKGARLIVVDPRPPEVMGFGDVPSVVWLAVRPGTDACLALAMLNTIVERGWYDKCFVRQWCVGFERLREHLTRYSPEHAEEVTRVPKDTLVEAARLFCSITPSCLYARLGAISQHINATQTARALALLVALGGTIDRAGGNMLSHGLGGFRHLRTMSQFPQFPAGVEERRDGARIYPFISAPKESAGFFPSLRRSHGPDCIEAIRLGHIRGLFVPGCNLVVAEGDSRKVWEALESLDFLVVSDFFLTPTAELADLVLPAAHFLETELPMRAYQRMGPRLRNYILASRRVVPPRGECWDDRSMVFELARKIGVPLPWYTVDAFNDWCVEPVGVKFCNIQEESSGMISFPLAFEQYREKGFNTPSGKIEVFSDTFAERGYEPLPSYREPYRSSWEKSKRVYPLTLITHRDIHYMHSEFRQLPSIRSRHPEPVFEINPQTANRVGIENGGIMGVETPGFDCPVTGRARFVSRLHPEVISCISHWWFPEEDAPTHGCFRSNINTVISHSPPYDPVTGTHQARSIPCRICKM